MTGPFGIKKTSSKRLTESVKIGSDTGELASQVFKSIHDHPLKTHSVDLVRLKITVKARDNLVKTLVSEKKIREKLFKGLLKLENTEIELHNRVFKEGKDGSIGREDFRRHDKLRTSIGFIFANLCQSYQRSEVNILSVLLLLFFVSLMSYFLDKQTGVRRDVEECQLRTCQTKISPDVFTLWSTLLTVGLR